MMEGITVAIAGGSGFIGRAIVRRLGDAARLRVLTRNPDAVREYPYSAAAARIPIAPRRARRVVVRIARRDGR